MDQNETVPGFAVAQLMVLPNASTRFLNERIAVPELYQRLLTAPVEHYVIAILGVTLIWTLFLSAMSCSHDAGKAHDLLTNNQQRQIEWWQQRHESHADCEARKWWALYEERIGKAVDDRIEELEQDDDEPSNKDLLTAIRELSESYGESATAADDTHDCRLDRLELLLGKMIDRLDVLSQRPIDPHGTAQCSPAHSKLTSPG